jgi:cation diffusion facilitator family transporter
MKEGSATRNIWLTVITYSALVGLLWGAFAVTNVLILFAQSLDRLSDVRISLFFLASLSISMRPADPLHAFGHTRVQNVAALIVSGILVFYLSLETFRETIPRIFDPGPVEVANLEPAFVVTLASMVIIAVPAAFLIKGRSKGLARAQLINLMLDELACAISLVALVFVSLGYPIADPLGSLMVGMAILTTGVFLFRENAAILVGRSPDKGIMYRLREAALSVEGVRGVHGLRAELVGPDTIHADLHIEIAQDTTLSDADEIAQRVRQRLKDATGCVYCEVHTDPYRPGGS